MQVNNIEFNTDIIDTGVLLVVSHKIPGRSLDILGKTTYEDGSMCHWQAAGSVGYILQRPFLSIVQACTRYPSIKFGEIIRIDKFIKND